MDIGPPSASGSEQITGRPSSIQVRLGNVPVAVALPRQASSVSPIWPYTEGQVRGESFSPLYKSAPLAAKNDPALYELLVLIDAIRGGRARERDIAKKELTKRLENYG